MRGRRIRRRPLPVVIAVIAVLVLAGGVVGVALHHGGHRATPAVVQLPTPSNPAAPPEGSATTPTSSLHWVKCGAAQCATLTVPLDWSGTIAAAKGRTVPVPLVRYPATGSHAQYLGPLLVNPGGPGDSGVQFVEQNISIFPAAIRARYDIVGFDPRGTGTADPVKCLTGTQLDALFALPAYPTNAAQEQQLISGAQEEANACASSLGIALGLYATVDVARDMDAIRAALGEAKLTYLGYSYGTYLGATYANMFPTHVRAMVLDGAINPDLSGIEETADQAAGFETAFNAFSAWCLVNTSSCPFGVGVTTVPALQAKFSALEASVAANPLKVGSRQVTQGEFYLGVLITLYNKASGWPALGLALDTAKDGDGTILLELADEFVSRNSNGTYGPDDEANLVVNCVDKPWPRTAAAYAALATQLSVKDPLFGAAVAWSGLGCAYWKAPAVGAPQELHAAGAPTILVVATTRDPATPLVEGQALAAQLDSGVLLTHNGDGHTAYSAQGSTCVQGIVNTYLLTLVAPSRATGAYCAS